MPEPKAVAKRNTKSGKKKKAVAKRKTTPTNDALETGDAPDADDAQPEITQTEQARTDPATPTSVSTTSELVTTPTASRKPDDTAASSVKTCKHCPVLGCSKCRHLPKGCGRCRKFRCGHCSKTASVSAIDV